MAAVCDVCGKGPGFGQERVALARSHQPPVESDIQRVRALVNGTPKRLNVCTKCLKSDKVARAI